MVLIELIFHIFFGTFGGCPGLEGTDFSQFVLWEDVEVLKELILNSFYFGRVCWS